VSAFLMLLAIFCVKSRANSLFFAFLWGASSYLCFFSRDDAGVDVMVVRELTGDVYFGTPKGIDVVDGTYAKFRWVCLI